MLLYRLIYTKFIHIFNTYINTNVGIWTNLERLTTPTLFLTMARNSDLCTHNSQSVQTLINVNNVASHQIVIEPRPLHPHYFSLVGGVLSNQESEQIYHAFMSAKLLWPGSGIFIEDPLVGISASKVKNISFVTLPDVFPWRDEYKYPSSPFTQLLSMSWGFRETTDEHVDDISSWFRRNKVD